MKYTCVIGRATYGIEAPEVSVEVHISNGLPAFNIVGLANAEVKESRERVRSALLNSGFDYPKARITVNLAPADLPKSGGRFDLAIAMGILVASEQLPKKHIKGQEFVSELGLNGELKQVTGIFIAAMKAFEDSRPIWVAKENADEAALSGSERVFTASSLKQLVKRMLSDKTNPHEFLYPDQDKKVLPCLSQIIGNDHAKRALILAACGGHNLLMVGTPGSGKTMLANSLPGIYPELKIEHAREVAALESLSYHGLKQNDWLSVRIRQPHHSCSQVAMVGGGKLPTPGEISLAHRGILFLDELPEFNRSVLESLRQPLEDNSLTVSRANWKVTFPANFQLIAAMNPCPCGYLTSQHTGCRCQDGRLKQYLDKLSGPLLDRIDIQVMVNENNLSILSKDTNDAYRSDDIRQRVLKLHEAQHDRQGCLNRHLNVAQIMAIKTLDNDARKLFNKLIKNRKLSMRVQQKLLRLALTISDWHETDSIHKQALTEAVSYRAYDHIHARLTGL